MIQDLKSYPAMKDSGVPWLGEVPEHWEVLRLGALMRERGETNDEGRVTDVLSVMRERGVIPYAEKGNVGNKKSDDITRYKVVRPDDIVVNCMNVIIGSVGISRYTGCLSPVYYVLTRRNANDSPHYLNAYFQAKSFQKSLVRIGNGILAHRMRIPMELLKCEMFPHPPIQEQSTIVHFLDHANRRIRRYIRAKQKLIMLLEEQKQAIIHRAVTRGLDPNVRMKPSGVEWLGDVPEHWEHKKIKECLRAPLAYGVLKPDKYDGEGAVPIVRIMDIEDGKIIPKHLDRISPKQDAEFKRTRVRHGDVVVSVVGTIGRSAVINNSLGSVNLSRALCRIQLAKNIIPEYFQIYCDSGVFTEQADRLPSGTAQRVLNLGDLRQLDICLPPVSEQEHIVSYVEEDTFNIRRALAVTNKEIDLVHEYRTRLIADVVTGKLDVRGVAASLPKETDELGALDDAEAVVDGDKDSAEGDLDAVPEEAEV